jgi:hypothetical protein
MARRDDDQARVGADLGVLPHRDQKQRRAASVAALADELRHVDRVASAEPVNAVVHLAEQRLLASLYFPVFGSTHVS